MKVLLAQLNNITGIIPNIKKGLKPGNGIIRQYSNCEKIFDTTFNFLYGENNSTLKYLKQLIMHPVKTKKVETVLNMAYDKMIVDGLSQKYECIFNRYNTMMKQRAARIAYNLQK